MANNKIIFEEIVVEYPPADLCTYPEYRGKPYFSIKYEENGEHFIGFGTYKPEVLSSYLKEYFIEADTESAERIMGFLSADGTKNGNYWDLNNGDFRMVKEEPQT